MSVFCVGCAGELGLDVGTCPQCKTPAVGACFEDEGRVRTRGQLAAPPVCCCCLGKIHRTRIEKVPMSFQVAGGALRQEHRV